MEPHASHIPPIGEEILEDLYAWVDQIPLSRPKKNFARDFSDGAMVAEIVMHYFPKFVEIHNYPSATGTKLKTENWYTLIRKVLRKFNYEVSNPAIDDIVNGRPYAIEHVLMQLRVRIDELLWARQRQITQKDAPEADQFPKVKSKKTTQKSTAPPALKPTPVKANQKPPAGASSIQRKRQPLENLSSQASKDQSPPTQSLLKETDPIPQKHPKHHQAPSQKTAENKQLITFQQQHGKTSKLRSTKPSHDSMTTVPLRQYQDKEMECDNKDETIEMLQLKVGKLEQLLQLKDLRIQELESTSKNKGAVGKIGKGKQISPKK